VSRDGMVTPVGTIHVTTRAEVVDNSICSGNRSPVRPPSLRDSNRSRHLRRSDRLRRHAAGSWSWTASPRPHHRPEPVQPAVGGGGRSCAGLALLGASVLIGSLRRRAFSRLPTEPAGASGTALAASACRLLGGATVSNDSMSRRVMDVMSRTARSKRAKFLHSGAECRSPPHILQRGGSNSRARWQEGRS